MSKEKPRFIISGGGTGGHIFPAVSIGKVIKRHWPGAEILFVGAEGRMEMEKVPAEGFEIVGLPVAGFNRKNLLKNFSVLLKLRKSLSKARKIIRDFQPDMAIGVGGYASGPTLKAAQKMGVPTLLQEQNSFAGVTNKLLAKKARKICVAYEGMDRFFPAEAIVMTGNPVRKQILECTMTPGEARRNFGLDPDKPTVLVVGGSLGARTINEAIQASLPRFEEAGVQLIWQTGKAWGDRGTKAAKGMKGIVVTQFLTNMDVAYKAATVVVSRAGASSISELELLGKACILVPSPNVAEDHQTKNAMALVNKGAAIMVPDAEAHERLADTIFTLLSNPAKIADMEKACAAMGLPDSDEQIFREIRSILGW